MKQVVVFGVLGMLLADGRCPLIPEDPDPPPVARRDFGWSPDRMAADLPLPPPDTMAADLPLPPPDTVPATRLRDHSVNAASAGLVNGVITLATRVRTNAPGGFNGSGVGNKAILGVSGYHKLPLARLPAIVLDYRTASGKAGLSFNMLVDLRCDGGEPKILVADGLPVGRSTTDLSKDAFHVVNNLDGKNKPPWLSTTTTLNKVLAQFPNACLTDAVSADNGMPYGAGLSALLLILGDSNNTKAMTAYVDKLGVGGVSIR